MTSRSLKMYRKPKLWRSSSLVVGHKAIVSSKPQRLPNRAHDNAAKRRASPTPAEARFAAILDDLIGGILRNRYFREWAFDDRWILDFYFDEVRLGIEIDGLIHEEAAQQERDRAKERACLKWSITLIRFTNEEVFGSRDSLERRLLLAWVLARRRFLTTPFARLRQSSRVSTIAQSKPALRRV